MSHLGYPEYFGTMLMLFKVAGAIVLIIPKLPLRLKEWAYAGFAFDFIAASYSYFAVEGMTAGGFLPFIALGILIVSYVYYHQLYAQK